MLRLRCSAQRPPRRCASLPLRRVYARTQPSALRASARPIVAPTLPRRLYTASPPAVPEPANGKVATTNADEDYDGDNEVSPHAIEKLVEPGKEVVPEKALSGIWDGLQARIVSKMSKNISDAKTCSMRGAFRSRALHHDLKKAHTAAKRGAFVFFPTVEMTNKAVDVVHHFKYDGRWLDAFLVKGVPWMEDLVTLRPTPRIKIELAGTGNLMPEEVFKLFRPFGVIVSLTTDKNTAIVTYASRKAAISARNCLHNYVLQPKPVAPPVPGAPATPPPDQPSGRIRITYGEWTRFKLLHTLWDLMKSPKIIPFVLLAIVLLLLMMIEPFRLISVAQTLTLNWREEDSRTPLDNAREAELQRLTEMFRKRPTGIVLIAGPEGVGKSTLLRKLLAGRRLAVRIDYAGKSSLLTEEGQLIDNLENAIGFSPSFNSINQALSVIESFLPMKQQGLGMTKQWQLTKIFKTLDSALKWISMSFPVDHQAPFDYPVIVFDGFHELIDGDKSKNLVDNLVRWALNTSQTNQTAHVVFISDNIFAEERLKSFSPLRGRINTVYIDDLTTKQAEDFVSAGLQRKIVGVDDGRQRLSPFSLPGIISLVKQGLRGWRERSNTATKVAENVTVAPEELEKVPTAVYVLGGRLTDLEALVVRFRAGKSVDQSLAEMIDDARKDIIIKGFGGKFASASTGKKWNKTQLWRSMKQISSSKDEAVDYVNLLDVVFEGDEEPLHALVKENVLGIAVRKQADGRETKSVTAHSPLLLASFREVVRDDTIRRRMEKLVSDEKVDKVKKDVKDIEEELQRLAKSKALSKNDSVSQREVFLHGKLQALNDKLRSIEEDYAKELAAQSVKK